MNRRFRRPLTVLALTALVTAGCGTRTAAPHGAAAAPASTGAAAVTPAPGDAPSSATGVVTSTPGAAQSPSPSPSAGSGAPRAAGSQSSAGSQSFVGQPTGAASKPSSASPKGPSAGPSAAAGSGGNGASGAGPGPLPATPGPAQPGQKSPVVIASAGTYSGPIGAILLPGTQAVQAWVAYINEKGGLNGHPVQLIIYDDGGDPARRQTQIQDAVERRGVIAFIHNAAPFESKTTQQYITSKRVPVVGTETGTMSVYESPMYFPQATSGTGNEDAALLSAAAQVVGTGKTKLASLTCVEAPQCAEADRFWAERAPAVGFQVVNRGRTSITQPDYTAECLAARNAQADVVIFALDPNSSSRLALSCARQGYKPIYATLASLALDRHKSDPNLDGMIQGSNVFPYFQTGTPATDEYQRVMKTYGSKTPPGGASAVGWVAAKLLEKAAAALPEPPTSASILAGLWQLRDDTLGGLTQPLTFVQDQPAKPMTCWYNLVIRHQAWTAFDDFKLHCR